MVSITASLSQNQLGDAPMAQKASQGKETAGTKRNNSDFVRLRIAAIIKGGSDIKLLRE